MSLSTRELELVLIARDRTSSVLARVGGSLTLLGVAIERLGAKGTRELGEMTNEAANFGRQVALAFTQAEGVAGVSLDSIKQMIFRVAGEIPQAFEEFAPAVFDIFSTLPVENMEQVEGLLATFAKSAVAGQAPIQNIGRATIAWLNALDMAPTVENANRILDVQFELVRKGAGTYEEFADEVGKAIPAFVAAGQDVETFGGALAFLTRNGLSAALASTAATRAVELLFRPRTLQGLRKLGIAVEDDAGNFRNMRDIIKDLLPHIVDLSDAERKIRMKEIFGTEGTIQARRFFDIVFSNFEEFSFLVDEMYDSAGEVDRAFELMATTPAERLDLMRNRLQILRLEIGERFLPLITDKLFPVANKLWGFWRDLSDVQKDNVARWLAIVSVGARVIGIMTTLVGILTLFSGLLKSTGHSLHGVFFRVLLMSAVVIGLALAIKWLIDNSESLREKWDKLWEWGTAAWEKIREVATGVIEFLSEKWDMFVTNNIDFFRRMWDRILEISASAQEAGADIWAALLTWWEEIEPLVLDAWERIKVIWDNAFIILREIFGVFGALFRGDWEDLMYHLENIWNAAWEIMKNVAVIAWEATKAAGLLIWQAWGDEITALWQRVVDFFRPIWEPIYETVKEIVDAIIFYIEPIAAVVLVLLQAIWDGLKIFWDLFRITILEPLQAIFAILTGDWEAFKDAVGDIGYAIRDLLIDIGETIVHVIASPFIIGFALVTEAWEAFRTLITEAWNDLLGFLQDTAQGFIDVLDFILGPFKNFDDDIFGRDLQGNMDIVYTKADAIKYIFGEVEGTTKRINTVISTDWKNASTAAANAFKNPVQLAIDKIWERVQQIFQAWLGVSGMTGPQAPNLPGLPPEYYDPREGNRNPTPVFPSTPKPPGGSDPGIRPMQHGGHFRTGMPIMVGEREPEFMRMGRSGSVFTLEQIAQLLSGGGGGGGGGHFYFGDIKLEGDPNELAREIGWAVRFA